MMQGLSNLLARRVPGPKRSLLSSILTIIKIGLRPYVELRNLRDRYGDPFRMWVVGMGEVVATGRPEHIKQIFGLSPDKFTMMNTPMLEFFFGSRSLFTAEGDTHRRDKKLAFPHFKGERMRRYGASMTRCTLDECAKRLEGDPVSLIDLSRSITLEVMMRTQLGITDEKQIEEIKILIHELSRCENPLLGYEMFRREFWGFGPWAKFQRYNRPLREYLIELIRERRKSDEAGEDILSLLAESRYEDGTYMDEEHVSDHVFALLIAGYDTTANSITWALERVLRDSHIYAQVLHELVQLGPRADPNELQNLPWLDAVCYEILRLYPPIEALPVRKLSVPLVLGDYVLSPGTGVCPLPGLTHRDPSIYEFPDEFRPQRFLNSKPSNFTFLPFGGGARLCMGFAFAHYQMRVVLGTCLRAFKFELLDPLPEPKRYSITIGPKSGSRVNLSYRTRYAERGSDVTLQAGCEFLNGEWGADSKA